MLSVTLEALQDVAPLEVDGLKLLPYNAGVVLGVGVGERCAGGGVQEVARFVGLTQGQVSYRPNPRAMSEKHGSPLSSCTGSTQRCPCRDWGRGGLPFLRT